MPDNEKVYSCWSCGTPVDRPAGSAPPPGVWFPDYASQPPGGLFCQCGKTYHNPNVKSQTAAEFFRRCAGLYAAQQV